MKIRKSLLLVTAAFTFLACLSSCKDDDDNIPEEIRNLREMSITGDVEIAGKIEKVTSTFALNYNLDNQLIEIKESYTGAEQTFTLTYTENKVAVYRNGNYYGEYTLNSLGYAESFTRPRTSTYYHEYSDEGYLIKSTYDEKEYTYSYEHGNLIRIDKGSSNVVFTPSNQIDNLNGPAFYQPLYLHIPGNIEVKVGYLAGLYGKQSYNLTASTVTTIGIGKTWEYNITVDYTYEKEQGYVTLQTEKSRGASRVFESTLTFTYD